MNTTASNKSARLQFIDAAKTFAIYLVIVYHIGQSGPGLAVASSNGTSNLLYFFHGFATVAVPLFFTINGYLVLNRAVDFRKNLIRTFRLYLLTLVWSLIIILCLAAIDHEHYTASTFVQAVFLLKHGDNNHLWFLFALTSIYLLLPAVKSIYDYPDRRVILWTLFVLFIFCFANIAANWCLELMQVALGHPISVVDGAIKMYRPLFIQGIDPFTGYSWAFVYFILGGLLEREDTKAPRPVPVWALCLILVIAALALYGYGSMVSPYMDRQPFDTVFAGYSSLPGMAMTLSIFLIFQRLWSVTGSAASLIASVGGNTLGIYLLHIPVLRLLNHGYFTLAISNCVPMNLAYALVILLSCWILTLLLKRAPLVQLLFRL